MFNHLPTPTIIAHRGASAHAPENTLAAFELALRQQADGIELDAKLCADGHVVVIHDQTVDRTTGGSGRVGDLPLKALRELDAGSHFDVAFKGEPIPTLAEVFELVGNRTFINIELTNYLSLFDALPEKVAILVKRHNMSSRVLFSSFNPVALRNIHRLVPDAPIGLLSLPGNRGALARGRLGRWIVNYQSLHLAFCNVTPALVKQAHRTGRRVLVYRVFQADEIRSLYALEVDGVIVDDPLLARRVLKTSDRIH